MPREEDDGNYKLYCYFSDKNMGLAKQVLASLYKRNIQRLTKTFLTLSLVDVANRAKLESVQQAESYIIEMVCWLCFFFPV